MSHHILIVEDDVMIQGFLTLTLENEGFRTTAVGSGAGLFTVLEHEKIDLIILDLGLPDSDGMDLLKEIRQHHTMPVIVASARRRTEDREMAIELGADAYVVKPFEPSDLVMRVKLYLGQETKVSSPRPAAANRRSDDVHDVHDVILNLAPQAEPVAETVNSTVPRQSSARKNDMMVMLAGVVVVGLALAGGGYWYLNYLDSSDLKADVTAPLQTPIAPSKPVQTPVIDKSDPVPTPKNLTESIVVQPGASADGNDLFAPQAVPIIEPSIPQRSACGSIPDVEWWRVKTHDQVKRYVLRKHQGDWGSYVNSWSLRLKKLQDIYQRGKAVKTGRGVILEDAELAEYVNQVAKRVAVINCLSEEASVQN